jgi:hypothetical protein
MARNLFIDCLPEMRIAASLPQEAANKKGRVPAARDPFVSV